MNVDLWLRILIIILLALVLHYVGRWAVHFFVVKMTKWGEHENKIDRKKRQDTLIGIFSAAVAIIVWIGAAAGILQQFNVDFASIAAGAGFMGLIIGIGAQSAIRDVLAGIFILTENQYRVGDVVTLNGSGVSVPTSGAVEEITLRITKLRGLDGTLTIVRNGEASIITNRTYEYSSIVLDIGVEYDSDIDLVEKVMNKIGNDMLKDDKFKSAIKDPINFLRVDDFADSAIMVKALGQVQPAMQWDIAGEYRRRLITEFRKNGITIALPQVVVHQAKDA